MTALTEKAVAATSGGADKYLGGWTTNTDFIAYPPKENRKKERAKKQERKEKPC